MGEWIKPLNGNESSNNCVITRWESSGLNIIFAPSHPRLHCSNFICSCSIPTRCQKLWDFFELFLTTIFYCGFRFLYRLRREWAVGAPPRNIYERNGKYLWAVQYNKGSRKIWLFIIIPPHTHKPLHGANVKINKFPTFYLFNFATIFLPFLFLSFASRTSSSSSITSQMNERENGRRKVVRMLNIYMSLNGDFTHLSSKTTLMNS